MLLLLLIPVGIVLAIAMCATPSSEPASAPAPTPTPGPYEGFRFEHVGVGIERLVGDGAGHRPGDYSLIFGPRADRLAIEPDGSLLTCCDQADLFDADFTHVELQRLGDPDAVSRVDPRNLGLSDVADMAVAPDGAIWTVGDGVASFTADGWTRRRERFESTVVSVDEDGTAWVGASDKSAEVVRIGRHKSRVFSAGEGLPKAVKEWGLRVTGIAPMPDGRVWVGIGAGGPNRPGGLLRYDGGRWRIVRPLGPGVKTSVEGLTASPDGDLWVYLSKIVSRDGASKRRSTHLARLDGQGWTVFDEADGVPPNGPRRVRGSNPPVLMRAGADGTVWLTPDVAGGCRSLMTFDEHGSSDYFDAGACVEDLELTADGRAWVSIEWSPWHGAEDWSVGLYLVDP